MLDPCSEVLHSCDVIVPDMYLAQSYFPSSISQTTKMAEMLNRLITQMSLTYV